VTPKDARARLERRRASPPRPVSAAPLPEPPRTAVPEEAPTPSAAADAKASEVDGETVFRLDLADHGVEVHGWHVEAITGVPGAVGRRVVICDQDGRRYSVSLEAWRQVPRSGRLPLEPVTPSEAAQ
jgi:hypothetical protein